MMSYVPFDGIQILLCFRVSISPPSLLEKHHQNNVTRKNYRYLYQYQYSIKQNQQIMPRGNTRQIKVVFKGKNDDFIVFVDSLEDVEKWKKDSSIPLAQVLNGWKIFCTDKYVYTFHCLRLLPSSALTHLSHFRVSESGLIRWKTIGMELKVF